MRVRKNALHMTAVERDNFLRAVLTLKNTIANPAAPVAQQINIYDQFVAIHLYTLSINVPGGASPINMGHQNSAFGPWHRFYLLLFEQALQTVDPTANLPYWDWTDHTNTQNVLFQDNFIGPNGGAGGVGGGAVQSGYFALDAPGSGTNPTPLPAWWPAGLTGWRVRPSLQQGWGATLQRSLSSFGSLATQANVVTTLTKTMYEDVAPGSGFRPALEGGTRMHNYHHGWVGGNMGDPNSSPNDLIFFLHHCNIDRLWSMWQIDGHQGPAFYPAMGRPQGHNLNDPMWPWIGALAGYSSNNAQTDVVLPDFTGLPIQTPADVLDHRALGYAYDTEPIMGVALDQTGSMTGMTPDPMTGMAPNVSKWDAAKRGVSFLLHDCEAAYSAREAYVTAGVETFRSLAVNTFTQIFPGTPYGVIKSGGGYSQASFDTNIAPQAPAGGTPLAGALSDTETNLVRAPYGNLPANEQRYLCILTDGKETTLPPLSTLGTPQFPDTIIFAMGFGIGGGWNGVDYATIADMTTKGKAAATGVSQVFHGENTATIDKFYTNSVAASIGYVPSVDPVFELFPGEHLHMAFDVTDADISLMITALGFDYSDTNWEFCLMAPDGAHCCVTRSDKTVHREAHHSHEHANVVAAHGDAHGEAQCCTDPCCRYLITLRRKNGRCTIFLNRNGAPPEFWVGRWYLMAFYKADPNNPMMVMPAVSDLLLPIGAPPVRGPLYTRYNQPVSQRPVLRAIPGKPAHALAVGLPGLGALNEGYACALSVNIFHKSTLDTGLRVEVHRPYAGQDFEIVLNLGGVVAAKFDQLHVVGRMVAPRHNLADAFADLQTIPLKTREKYFNRENRRAPFNEIQYLADYERRKPGVFPLRDEELNFEPGKNGVFRAKVTQNRFPGVYRVAVRVLGNVELGPGPYDESCCKPGPQVFSRVLNVQVALGILPDAKKSKATLHWLAPNQIVVTVTPMDHLGNIAAPINAAAPVAIVDGKEVRATHDNPYTGEQQLYIALEGQEFRPTPDGHTVQGGSASIEVVSGEPVVLHPGEQIKIEVEISGSKVPVHIPILVGDTNTHTAYEAGTSQGMRIPLANRAVFASEKEAKDAGYSFVKS